MDDGRRGTRRAALTAIACVLVLSVVMGAWAVGQLVMDPNAEIARLASGVDLMVRRTKQDLEPDAVDEAQARLRAR